MFWNFFCFFLGKIKIIWKILVFIFLLCILNAKVLKSNFDESFDKNLDYEFQTIFLQSFLINLDNKKNFFNIKHFSNDNKITFETVFITSFKNKNAILNFVNFLKNKNFYNFIKYYETGNLEIKKLENSEKIDNFNIFEKVEKEKEEFLYDEDEKITLKAKHVSRDNINKFILADGNVISKYKDSTCYSDMLEYRDGEKISKAYGNVRLYESDGYIKGQNIIFDMNNETGEVINAKTFSESWIITSKKLEKISKEKIIAYKAKITTCDYDNPHYYLKSKKVVVYLNNKFIAYHTFLYIKGVPVFYLPIWKQSLKKKKLTFTIRAGQSSTNGFYGKVKTTYTFDNANDISLYTDDYEYRGFGIGLGGHYNFKKTHGSFYLYKIDDLVDMASKKTMTINHSQEINNNLKLYMNVNYQNDESFYKTYYYSGVSSQLEPTDSQVNANIYSYSSLFYTKDFYYMNFLWEEESNWEQGKYKKSIESLPSFSFTTNRNNFFKTGLYYKYNFDIKNRYRSLNDDYYVTGNSSFNLSKSKKISRRITFNPTVGITENFSELYDNKYKTKLTSNLAFKTRLNSNMDFDTTYIYNAGIIDSKSIDRNKINLSLSSYLLDGNIRITNTTGYDLKLNKTYSNELDKLDPFYTEIKYKVNKSLNYYGKHIYDLKTKKTTFFQNIFYFYPSAKLTFVENATYLNSKPNILDSITTIKFRPNLKWKMDYSYRFYYDYEKSYFHSYSSHEIAILRDIHCFDVKFSYLAKSENSHRYREFWITLRLKALYDQDISLYRNNRDYKKWYDWDFKNA